MSIGSRIKDIRIEKKLTQEELARMIGVTKGAIANYENEVSVPKTDILFKLMKALNCDANYLYQDDIEALNDSNFKVTIPEQKIIEKYRSLDEHGSSLVKLILETEYERCTTIKESEPVYGEYAYCMKSFVGARLSAGTGQFVFDDVPTDLIEVPIEFDYIDFVIEVSGDSMEPDYYAGDKVMIVKQPQINIGEIGAFMIDGEAYIKELGTDRLISHNKKYNDIIFNESMRIDCIGKVVGKLEKEIKNYE